MTEVLITAPFSQELIDKIQAVSSDIEIEQMTLQDGKWPEGVTTSAEVLYVIGGLPHPEQVPELRWVQTHWAGIEGVKEKAIWNSDIQITNSSGIHAPNIAQYVMAQLLTWSNHVPKWLKYQRQSEWPKERWKNLLPDELRNKTLGILGYGSLGREIARLAKSFGMTVLATKKDARKIADEGYTIPGTGDPEGVMVDRIYPAEATRFMVADCDFVVITLPLTDNTHHLVDESVFKTMKPNCFLVNVGRGAVVRETDLIKALERGWIAGAGLDVFETEPLPDDSPLWGFENVIISPHVSGMTPYYDDRATDLFAENLRRYLAGEPLLNLVNRQLGY